MTFKIGNSVQVKADAKFGYPHTRQVFLDCDWQGFVDAVLQDGTIIVSAVNQKDYEYFSAEELTLIEAAPETSHE